MTISQCLTQTLRSLGKFFYVSDFYLHTPIHPAERTLDRIPQNYNFYMKQQN